MEDQDHDQLDRHLQGGNQPLYATESFSVVNLKLLNNNTSGWPLYHKTVRGMSSLKTSSFFFFSLLFFFQA